MYKYIFLDLDNTILNFDAAEDVAIRKAFAAVGIEPTEDIVLRYKQINILQWERFERGEISREEVLISRYDILFAERGIDLPGWKCEEAYREFLGVGHYFLPGAVELLDYLKRKGYHLFIASNGVAATQDSRLDSAGIRPYFDNIFISESAGHHKPEKEYFDYCFAAIPGFSSKEALIVGDSLTSDIRGGKTAGISTCWLNPRGKTPPPELTPDYEIHALSELKNIL